MGFIKRSHGGDIMEIIKANKNQVDIVKRITNETIYAVYPHYYAMGIVDFFSKHHNELAISNDIQAGCVFVATIEDDAIVGTVTIKENEICRLFVLPQYQKMGYGSQLLDFAECSIFQQYDTCVLDASLASKEIYLHRGYSNIGTYSIQTDSKDVLCYDKMSREKSE